MIINHFDYFNEISAEASKLVERHTLQLYLYQVGIPPIPVSSSVLVKTDLNYYLLTAAHVLIDNPRDSIFILDVGSGGKTVAGQCVYSKINDDERANKTDIAIVQLNRDLIPIIRKLNKEFFDITKYNLDFTKPDDMYMVYGYPNSQTILKRKGKVIRSKSFKFLTSETDKPVDTFEFPWILQ